MAKKFVVKSSKCNNIKTKIVAADDDINFDEEFNNDFSDTLDDVADTVEDIQDTVEDTKEDPVNIEIENNITDHYIAECEKCQGIFISAMVESDQVISKVTGECPLCGEESDQYLKWIIRTVSTQPTDINDMKYMHNQ